MDENLLIEIMSHLDLRSLNRFVLSNTLAYKLSNDPRFYLRYNIVNNDDEYDGDYIWTGENTKTKEDLNHELDEIEYYNKQYYKYKNSHHQLF